MKFFFFCSAPDSKHRDGSFTRHVSAVTMDDPREPGRPAYLNLSIEMTAQNQSVELIKQAIEARVGQPIEIAGAFPF